MKKIVIMLFVIFCLVGCGPKNDNIIQRSNTKKISLNISNAADLALSEKRTRK